MKENREKSRRWDFQRVTQQFITMPFMCGLIDRDKIPFPWISNLCKHVVQSAHSFRSLFEYTSTSRLIATVLDAVLKWVGPKHRLVIQVFFPRNNHRVIKEAFRRGMNRRGVSIAQLTISHYFSDSVAFFFFVKILWGCLDATADPHELAMIFFSPPGRKVAARDRTLGRTATYLNNRGFHFLEWLCRLRIFDRWKEAGGSASAGD